MLNRNLFFASLLVLCSGFGAVAGEVTADQVDRLFARFAKPDSPGGALAVVRGDTVLYENGYGMADLEHDVPITPTTIFHVASVSKQFTCFAIALLAAAGKLSLDDDIRKYVPEVPDFGKRITLRHLMNHTSGLRDQWSLLIMAGWRMDDVITEGDVLDIVSQQRELNFPPGERHLYSNTGHTLLAVVVQRATGQTLRAFAEQEMFEPLGMVNTHFHDDHRMLVKGRAHSYAPKGEKGFEAMVLSYATVGATSLFTTVEDLVLWQQNFAAPTVGDDQVFAIMLEPGKLNDGHTLRYAAGLSLGQYRGLRTIGHSGGDAGFRSYLVRFPDQELSIALLANAANLDADGLAYQVADLYLADEFTEPKATTPPTTGTSASPAAVTVPSSVLDRIAGLYVNRRNGDVWMAETASGRLSLRGPAGMLPMVPASESRFLTQRAGDSLEIEFAASPNAPPAAARVTTSDSPPEDLVRVEPVPLGKEYLWDYPGDYHSDELDVSYRLLVRDGELIVTRRKYGERTLRAMYRDGFLAADNSWVFTRDAQGRVDGALVSAGRVLNLRFRRLP